MSDVPDEIATHVYKFSQAGIVYCVETRSVAGSASNVWQTDRHAWEYVNDVIGETHNAGPCDHSGLRNLGDGEYTCTNDDCSVTCGRDVALERV